MKGGIAYAVGSIDCRSDRGGRPFVDGESLHPNAGNHQIDPERRRRHRGCFVATECFRDFAFPFPDSRWGMKHL
jgi:hypothetical protein